ncbi:MAG TPA: hypothetical protein VKU00_05120 [Chthonomonadaceae bacterium]|nr:hypothetical protein [Chthonomonadaceae bacterium]
MVTLKNSRILLPIAGLLTITGIGIVAAGAQTPPPTPTPAPAPAPKHPERHPELVRALKSLQKAQMDLQKANRDFDGHRAKAEQLTDQAIQEVKLAIQSDKN